LSFEDKGVERAISNHDALPATTRLSTVLVVAVPSGAVR
jgi:hypothetical protein